jgi:hypothetical protein
MKRLVGVTLFANLFDPIANPQASLSGRLAAVWLGLVGGSVSLAWLFSGAGVLLAGQSALAVRARGMYLVVFPLATLLLSGLVIHALVGD